MLQKLKDSWSACFVSLGSASSQPFTTLIRSSSLHLFKSRRKPISKILSSQSGAAVIEAMGTMLVFLGALLVSIFMGITFYNTNTLNSASQNIALNTQVQLDRFCSPQQNTDCSMGIDRAAAIRETIITNTNSQLPFSEDIQAAADLRPPSITETTFPGRTFLDGTVLPGTVMPAGWGYNTIRLSAQQTLFGSNSSSLPAMQPLTLVANSMSTSYKDPSR